MMVCIYFLSGVGKYFMEFRLEAFLYGFLENKANWNCLLARVILILVRVILIGYLLE